MVATSYLPGYFSGELQESDTQMILSGIETQLDAAVWFVSRDGNMIASAHSGEYPSAPDTIKDFDPAESGSDRSQTGDYHGYFDNDVITVTVPVTYGYFPKGYLMIHQYTTVVDNDGYIDAWCIYHIHRDLPALVHYPAGIPFPCLPPASQDHRSCNTVCFRQSEV